MLATKPSGFPERDFGTAVLMHNKNPNLEESYSHLREMIWCVVAPQMGQRRLVSHPPMSLCYCKFTNDWYNANDPRLTRKLSNGISFHLQ